MKVQQLLLQQCCIVIAYLALVVCTSPHGCVDGLWWFQTLKEKQTTVRLCTDHACGCTYQTSLWILGGKEDGSFFPFSLKFISVLRCASRKKAGHLPRLKWISYPLTEHESKRYCLFLKPLYFWLKKSYWTLLKYFKSKFPASRQLEKILVTSWSTSYKSKTPQKCFPF